MLGFPQIDVQGLKHDLKVREQAILQARNDLPLHTDTELDAAQHSIVHVIGQKLEEARSLLSLVAKTYDSAAASGVIHHNTAARYKSRLTRRINRQQAAST